MIFWLMLKLDFNYRVIKYLEGFWFLLEDFLKIIFLKYNLQNIKVKYLSFHNPPFALRYFLMSMARQQCDTPLVMPCHVCCTKISR
jgi:hypothetical protein